jgi:ribulose 1,5-bisphosphate carboxylase large subunit-like protein
MGEKESWFLNITNNVKQLSSTFAVRKKGQTFSVMDIMESGIPQFGERDSR